VLTFQYLSLHLLFILGSGSGTLQNLNSKLHKPNLALPSKSVSALTKIMSKSIAFHGPLDDGAFIFSISLFMIAYYKQFQYSM
jgi:hypothetical protein